MRRFILGRMLAGVPVLFAAVTLSFALVHLLPGDPVDVMLDAGAGGQSTPQQRDALRHELGLDASLPTQYVRYIGNLVQGDSGRSIQSGESVTSMIVRAVPPSLALGGTALVLALALGIAVALAGASSRNPLLRALASGAPAVGIAVPAYWVGIVLMSLFAFRLGWLPATGNDGLASLVLPAATLALPAAAIFGRVLSASLREALAEPYVLLARAKGAGDRRVLMRHALRNALIPTVTVTGLAVGQLLAGAFLVETVFAREGLGRTVVAAVDARDLPVVEGFVVFMALIYVAVNLVIDVLYGAVDPRVTVAAQDASRGFGRRRAAQGGQ
ncbi:ABC transporter permease [Frankia sp. QA3]|uniref:ABC transporter permease n=1 Tax=Frankia sp. QA3 TaxID=710111 RepID=UPI000269C40B|nr:ABC transporter permease [Frankia sp. QA3]EIV93862.1 ABC-type dipeptide/oligopeptide/nickel transport system, permease component [Frankia sp. QA3]